MQTCDYFFWIEQENKEQHKQLIVIDEIICLLLSGLYDTVIDILTLSNVLVKDRTTAFSLHTTAAQSYCYITFSYILNVVLWLLALHLHEYWCSLWLKQMFYNYSEILFISIYVCGYNPIYPVGVTHTMCFVSDTSREISPLTQTCQSSWHVCVTHYEMHQHVELELYVYFLYIYIIFSI